MSSDHICGSFFDLTKFRSYSGEVLAGANYEESFSPNWKPINIAVGHCCCVMTGLKDCDGKDICEGDVIKCSFESEKDFAALYCGGRLVVRYSVLDARFVIMFERGKRLTAVDEEYSHRVFDLNVYVARNCRVISNVLLMELRRLKTNKLIFGVKFSSAGFKISDRMASDMLDYIHENVPLEWNQHVTSVKAKMNNFGTITLFFKINDGAFQKLHYAPLKSILLQDGEEFYVPGTNLSERTIELNDNHD